VPAQTYEAPVQKNTDYAVKAEAKFAFEEPKNEEVKPKINWAEKLQNAATKYENQENTESTRSEAHFSAPTHNQIEAKNNEAQSRESRIKSIAEKLGFFNFDEDEFDTPAFMKKNDRHNDTQV